MCSSRSLVHIILDGQQVVSHRLESELVQDGRGGIETPVQNDELRPGLVRTLQRDVETFQRCAGV